MRDLRDRALNLVILITAGLCTACALTSMRSIQRAPDFRGTIIHHVLVIGDFENQSIRKSFEEEFVRQWSRYGVQAVSSLDVLPSSAPITKDLVAPVAKARSFDTVLVARVLERKTIHPGEPIVPTIQPPSQGEPPDSNSIWQIFLSPPVSATEFQLVTAETNLYDVASERRLWSGWSETEEMKKIPKLIPPFVKLILKHLYESPGK
jgi:hypothetical protein